MADLEIHYKTTIWQSIKFPEGTSKKKILEELNKGELPEDIAGDYPNTEFEMLYGTEEFIPVSENDGQSTIELVVREEDGYLKPIWDNSYESEIKRKTMNKKDEYPYEFICKDCGEDFASKDPKNNCAACSSPNVKRLN